MDVYNPTFANERGAAATVVQVQSIGKTGIVLLSVMSGLALGISIFCLIFALTAYRELERETRLLAQATDDMRASLIARNINPNNHDITDPGGNKP